MSLPLRGSWDVTHLAAKYPWLRVDQVALEEFRSPFHWVSDTSPRSPARSSRDGNDDERIRGREYHPKKGEIFVRGRKKEVRPGRHDRHQGKKKRMKTSAIQRNHERLFPEQDTAGIQATNNSRSSEDVGMPPLDLSMGNKVTQVPLLSSPIPLQIPDRLEDFDPVLEMLQQDHESLVQARQQKKKKQTKRKKTHNLLSLRFPVISPKSLGSVPREPKQESMMSPTPQSLLEKYSQQIRDLAEEEQRLEESVMARITEEKTRLPLPFLFERNLMRRSDAQQDGLRVVTAIFAKLQHRMLYNGYTRWKEFLESAQHEDRKREGFRSAQRRAAALLQRVSSDAYVGTLAQGFQRWKTIVRQIEDRERNHAAGVIQKAVRARRSRQHIEVLRLAGKARDQQRNHAIEAMLRFERFGTMMKWSTLRIGFDFAKQTRAARNLQLFLRRVFLRRRIAVRVMCRQGAVRIQSQWRARVARYEVSRRRAERARRIALEFRAATQIQCTARGLLARRDAFRRRQWLAEAQQTAPQIQRWWRHQSFIAILHQKFRERKRLIDYARARADAEELARLRWRSALAVQCVLRGLFARKVYERRLKAYRREQAAIYLQRFWRRRRGLYALGLRFAERRERIVQCRLQSAIVLQCAFRCFCARRTRFILAADKESRRRASTAIQRHVRGRIARRNYGLIQYATLVIQCSIRCALARRQRTRRYESVLKLQRWLKGIYSCRAANKILNELRVEAKRREASVIFIQKLIRQKVAEQTARLFREALNIIKIEQRRYFGNDSGGIGWATHQASSELLTYVTQRFLEDGSCFTTKELLWLRVQVQAGRERLAREDRAAVYMQRRFRGYATLMGYWVHRLQLDELRRLREKKAIVIQSVVRRWLAKRYVRRLREQRRLAELKEAYIRERKRKEEERLWKERYDREQMELCVQRAQEAANALREARREADLARVKAEAAEYRAKELAAEREIEAILKTPTNNTDGAAKLEKEGKDLNEEEKEEEKDPWKQYADYYGNAYYYNEITGESSWGPPPPRKKKQKVSSEEEEVKEAQTEKVSAAEEVKEVDPLEEVLREGKCIKCHQEQATKRCLDCEDTKRAFYCIACFKTHKPHTDDVKHDFEVVPEAALIPALCESGMECVLDEDNPATDLNNKKTAEKGLAAYYCYECLFPSKLDSTTDADATTKSTTENELSTLGCFYCESCFARDHETVKKLRHVEKALRFRRGALLCCDCGHSLAVRQCESCEGDKFCEACFTSSHTGSQRRSINHTWTALDVLRDQLEKETDMYCVECDVRASSRLCNLCGDGFCAGCFDKTHAKGAKRRHTWLPWSVAAQHGDWIEIKDDKSTIYFNVETKESKSDKPSVLLSGEERHRLVLAEREQLQRSREIELESEVVKLKEQLREFQAQDRPQSHARTPTPSTITHPQSVKTDTKPLKPPKQGVLSKFFGKNPPPSTPTLEELQRIPENPANQVETDKQSLSSPAFQQAMVQEILAVSSPRLNKPK